MTDQTPPEGDGSKWQLVIAADAEVIKAETITEEDDN